MLYVDDNGGGGGSGGNKLIAIIKTKAVLP